ncbi:MAG TPA: isoprenylcysteine carboxylmethyltransferase family protein [Methanoregula sp.]|nr:isoprenylcysteine carboxylmethyltransferase family protein [Methanoregula sp.]
MTDENRQVHVSRTGSIAKSIIFIAIMGLFIFVPAGTLDWPMAWVLMGIYVLVFSAVILLVSDGLLEERSKRHTDSKPWDRILVTILFIMGFAVLAIAGLDHRFGWTGELPLAVEICACVLVILGNILVIWAAIKNDFFSATVRIQEDREHTVVSTGPYRFVRHPGYVGMITYVICQPLMLGSLIALVPALVTAGLFLLRTSLEDRTLQGELPGYREYAGQVRYRLVPGVW